MNYLDLLDGPTPTATDATNGRCPKCSELIRRGAQDALCAKCPAWPLQLYSREEIEQHRRECMDPTEGEVYVRAGRLRQCDRCRDLESRGVIVLHCSTCDVLTDCPACKRLGVVCGSHYHSPGEDAPGPVIGTEYLGGSNGKQLRYGRSGRTRPPKEPTP